MDEMNVLPELEEVEDIWRQTNICLPVPRYALTLRQKLKKELEEESPSFILDGTTFYKLRQEEERVRSDLKQLSKDGQLAKESELLLTATKTPRSTSPLQKVYIPDEPIIAAQCKRNAALRERKHSDEMVGPSTLPFEILSSSSEDPYDGLSSPSMEDPFTETFGGLSVHQNKYDDLSMGFYGATGTAILSPSHPVATSERSRERISRRHRHIESDDIRASIPTSRQARQARFDRLNCEKKASYDGNTVHDAWSTTRRRSGEQLERTSHTQNVHALDDQSFADKHALQVEIQNLKNELAFYQALYSRPQSSASVIVQAKDSDGRIISHQRRDVERIAYLQQKVERLSKQNSLDSSRIAILRVVKEDLEIRNRLLKHFQKTVEHKQYTIMKEKKMLAKCLRETQKERDDLALEVALTKPGKDNSKLIQVHEDVRGQYCEDSRNHVKREAHEADVVAVRQGLRSLFSEVEDCQATIRWTLNGWGIRPGKSIAGSRQAVLV